jgi:nucleotide-binding universal stress UspA family protein
LRKEGGVLKVLSHIPEPLSRVLVPTDFSEVTDPLMKIATYISKKYGSEIVLLHVIEEGLVEHIMAGYNVSELIPTLERESSKKLEALEERLKSEGARVRVYPEIPVADPAVAITSIAEEVNASEILIASKGWGWRRLLSWGSTSRLVVKMSRRPVIYVRASKEKDHVKLLYRDEDFFKNILYARKSSHPKELVEYLISLAKKTKGRVVVIRVPEGEETAENVSKELEPLTEKISYSGVNVERVIVKGNVTEEILRASEVLGATSIFTGRSISRSLHEIVLGSTLGKILSVTKVPIIIYPE